MTLDDVVGDGRTFGMIRGAIIDDSGLYRYRLTRQWDVGTDTVCWVMLNPSIADAHVDDMTIRKCVKFSRRLDAVHLVVVNLYAFRATQPADLLYAFDPVGPLNERHVREAIVHTQHVVFAWGAAERRLAMFHERIDAEGIARRAGKMPLCLGRTRTGEPRHPSRLGYHAEFEPWLAD